MVVSVEPLSPVGCSQCRGELPVDATFCPHCGTRQDTRPPIGPTLPGYTIVRSLGTGGAADVYLARQDALDRDVAVKVLRRDVDDSTQWRRFQREARTIARLSAHPHVVTVHTAGRAGSGQPYLVTEYLDRGSLANVVAADGPLSPGRAARVGVAIADALIAAHELGILHRDVKPGNVLLGHDGSIKLGDFGIARLLESRTGATTDVIAFTPEHVAPELLRGEPDGPWSDVYGLASTVTAALLGHSLFQMGPEERVDAFLARRLTTQPPVLPEWVPASLARPLMNALHPDPRRRPPLAELRAQLAAAAGELANAAPPEARPSTPTRPLEPRPHQVTGPSPAHRTDGLGPPGPRSGARTRWTVLLAALVLVGALAAAAVTTGLFSADDDQQATVTTVAGTTTRPTPTSPTPTAATTSAAGAPAPDEGTAWLTPTDAERYLRTYYGDVAAGDYQRTWAQLAPEFQSGTARSFEYYAGFWDDNDVELGAVELVGVNADRAVVTVELRWNGSSEATLEELTLRRGDDGTILIAEQRTVAD